MGILQSEGIGVLLRQVADEAAGHAAVEDAARHAASYGGRIPARLGLQALTREEEHLLRGAAAAGARMTAPAADSDLVFLSATGRLHLGRSGRRPAVEELHMIGGIHWRGVRPVDLDTELDRWAAQDSCELEDIHGWVQRLPTQEVQALIARVRQALLHMAPVILYTGHATYTNLGKRSNLVGKSVRADSARCRLNHLTATPPAEWSIEDAAFVTCLDALIASGTPVRAEEFNGTQLRPDRLIDFLEDKVASYGASLPTRTTVNTGDRLRLLAEATAAARRSALGRGFRPYRLIEGLNLNKQERLERRAVELTDVPTPVLQAGASLVGCAVPSDLAEWAAACRLAMPVLMTSGTAGFASRYEQVLHELTLAATRALGSDVGMTRGPRRPAEIIAALRTGADTPLSWTTKDFFCCVTPAESFVDRFAEVPEQLPQVVRAISARMRYNGWHYLPHCLGVDTPPASRDWFFAPTMPDITDLSNQHHTGHVANGVRYAIRVPFGVDMVRQHRPGLHDFRVMRVEGVPYTEGDLRAAIGVGELLRSLYQAHADVLERHLVTEGAPIDIHDFENPWYQARYAPELTSELTDAR